MFFLLKKFFFCNISVILSIFVLYIAWFALVFAWSKKSIKKTTNNSNGKIYCLDTTKYQLVLVNPDFIIHIFRAWISKKHDKMEQTIFVYRHHSKKSNSWATWARSRELKIQIIIRYMCFEWILAVNSQIPLSSFRKKNQKTRLKLNL